MTTTRNDDTAPSTKSKILDLKRQALQCKREGNLSQALELLRHAKQLEAAVQQEQQQQQQQQPSPPSNPTDESKASSSADPIPIVNPSTEKDSSGHANDSDVVEMNPQVNDNDKDPLQKDDHDNHDDDDEDLDLSLASGDEEILLQELHGDTLETDDTLNETINDTTAVSVVPQFSLEELQDEATMVDFKCHDLPVPSSDTYQAEIQKQLQLARTYRDQGDNPATKQLAVQHLRIAKQLQKVHTALYEHMVEGTLGLRFNNDDDGWLEQLTPEESALLGEALGVGTSTTTTTDQEPMQPFTMDELEGMDAATVLELIETLDQGSGGGHGPASVGHMVPTVEDLQQHVKEWQQKAIQCKTSGQLEDAKNALRHAKKIQNEQIPHLQQLWEDIRTLKRREYNRQHGNPEQQDDGTEITDQALEALLLGENESATKQAEEIVKPKILTAEDYKQQAIHFRDAKNMVEATRMLKLYKQALAKEQEQQRQQLLQEQIDELQTEIHNCCVLQIRYFTYYQVFGNEQVGKELLLRWKTYQDSCQQMIQRLLQEKEHASAEPTLGVPWTRKKSNVLLQLASTTESSSETNTSSLSNDAISSFCAAAVQDKTVTTVDDRIEFGLLDVRDIEDNKAFVQWRHKQRAAADQSERDAASITIVGRVRVTLSLQLPPSEEQLDQSIQVVLTSTRIEKDDSSQDGGHRFVFDDKGVTHFSIPARGDSKFAKKLVQRMERRRIQLTVHYLPDTAPSTTNDDDSSSFNPQTSANRSSSSSGGGSKGWFWSSKTSHNAPARPPTLESTPALDTDILLGRVTLEAKTFLTDTCIAGDYPLVSVGGKPLGGWLGLCLRTQTPFGLMDNGKDDGDTIGTIPANRLIPYPKAMAFSNSGHG